MNLLSRMAIGGVLALAVVGCAGNAPASTTLTVRTTQVVPTTVVVTSSVGVTVSAPALGGNASLTTDQAMCLVVFKALDYVAAVEVNYKKQDGSAPIDFLQKVAKESSDTFDLFSGSYLEPPGISTTLRDALNSYDVSVTIFESRSDDGVAAYDGDMARLRSACASPGQG